ncbi:CHAT domain-containing protein [Actinosynnema sp. NPDC053489]|uniref:CHAT domain-containing protein n=1 Tax=Actinosynnema sp. NPDC053489 TaxID=3363916 RepID=UPI0037C95FB2
MTARRADELSGLGRWREAVAEYRAHLEAHPDDVDARTGLGTALRAVADPAGAVAAFDRVLAVAPDLFPPRYQRALALAGLGRDEEAVEDLDRLIAGHPEVWYLFSDRGALHARRGDVDGALRDLVEAVRLAPEESFARYNLGLVLAETGRLVEAHHHLAHAAGGSPDAARARNDVRRTLLARASRDDLEQAVHAVFDAGSADEVATLADVHPFVLTERFVELVEAVAGTPGQLLPAQAWRRVEDLRLLVDDAPGEAPSGSFGDVSDLMVALHESGEHEAAHALAPQVARLAEDEFGTGSLQHARQVASWAVLALRVDAPDAGDLVATARELLSRADPATLTRLLVSLDALRPGPEGDRALDDALAVVRDPAVAVDAEDAVRVYRARGRRLFDAGRYAEAEDVLREAVAVPGVEGDRLAELCTGVAEAVFQQGRPADAVPWCERALDIRRAEHGETDHLVGTAMRELGQVLQEAGDLGGGESWLRRAAQVWSRLPGRDGEVAEAEAELAGLYAAARMTDEASAAIGRAREAVDRMPEPGAVLLSVSGALNALANAHYWAGRGAEALPLYREALHIVENSAHGDARTLSTLQQNIVNTLDLLGQADEAPDRDVAAEKHNLALDRLQRGTRTGVVPLLREALALDPDNDLIRLDLAEALSQDDEDDEAARLLSDVLDRGDQRLRGRALTELAVVVQRRGDLAVAQRLLREAVVLADADGTVENRVDGRQHLTLALVRGHDLAEAYETAQQAVTLALDAFGTDAPLTALSELTWARVLTEDGRRAEAEPVIRRAIATLERQVRPEDAALVSACNDLANCLLHQGQPHHAVPWFRRALAADTAVSHTATATIAQNLAFALASLGDFASAGSLAADAAARVLAQRGPDDPRYGAVLATLGQIELAGGDLWAAADHLVAACRIFDNGSDERVLAVARSSLADLYLRIGATRTALSFAVAAETSARARYSADNPVLAPILSSLAKCRAATGDPEVAERLYQEVLDLVPWSRADLIDLAELRIATGAHDEAYTTLERLVAQEDADLTGVLADATGPLRTAHFRSLGRTVTAYLNLVMLGHDSAQSVRRAWELSVRRRGLDAEYLELRATAPKSADLRRELAQVSADISRAVLAEATDDLPRLRTRHDELEHLLAGRVPAATLAARMGSVDADAVLAALPPDTTLVDVVRADDVDFGNTVLGAAPADRVEYDHTWRRHPTRYLAFVIGTERKVRVVDLGPTEPVDELVRAVRRRIYAKEADTAATEALAACLTPVLRQVSTERLLVTADGPLAQVPWQVLPTGPDRLLLDDHTVSYLSSPREVLRWQVDRPTTAPLVVGDPDFDLDGPPGRLDRLAATRTECAEIADLLAVKPLLDRAATKAAVLAVRSPTILHLATHGVFLPPAAPPEPSDIYDTINLLDVPGEGTFLVDARRYNAPRPDVDALLSSAVALTGINAWITGHPTPPEVDTGALTAQEACAMDLRGTRLVVLSACETGLGDHSRGEGIVGLRWALRVAGAHTVVTALWKVPDKRTRQLMVLFYQRLLAGDTAPDALRAAQRTMRDRGLDLSVWGAFVLHGRPTGILTTASWPSAPRLSR